MQDLRKIFRYARPYRRDLFAAVGLIFIECIFEMVIPVLMSTLVDDGVPAHNMAVIFRQGGLMILCAVLALITGLLYARYAARFANGFAAELRMAEYAAVQKFDFANLDRFSDASLVTRMTTDVTVMLNAVNAGLRPLVRSPVMLCMGLAMACVLSPRLTIVFLVTTPILAAVLAWIVTKVGPLYGRQQSAVDHLNGRIQESLTAIRAIKAFVRGGYENAQFDTVNTELSDASTETFRYAVLNLPAFQAVMYTAIVCILWFGGNYILVGTMSVGQLTAFLSYVLQVLNSVMMFSGVFLQMSRSLASARRIREVLTETPDLANAAAPVDTIPDGQIDFDHVSFKYNAKAEKNALSDITLHIPAGATVGIIGGTGAAKGTSPETCPDCHGSGYVTVQQRTPFGVMQSSQPCSRCGGKGKIIKSPCSKCHGSGKTSSTKRVEVKVPAGIDDDQSMRLTGLGDAGLNGGPSGDLIVIVTVRPDAMFERDRFDVHVTVPVTYSQAVLGAEVVVPTIDGKVQYTVPEGTQSGTTFRLRGKGIQYVNGRGRGDQYVKVVVEIPKKLTKTQRDALKKFEDTLKDDNYEQRKGFFKSLRDKFENG